MFFLHGQSAANAAGANSNNGGRLHNLAGLCARPNKVNGITRLPSCIGECAAV